MNELSPEETIIVGGWHLNDTKIEADDNCKRIEWLIKSKLRRIASDESGWDTLFQDTKDGRYWEHYYPQSHMHGGGPPSLKYIAQNEANKKYGVNNAT